MGIPIFVRSSYQEVRWALGAGEMTGFGLKVPVLNQSGQHVRVENLQVSGLDAQGEEVFSSANNGWYVLAEHTRAFVLPIDPHLCSNAKTLKFSATVDDATRDRQMALDPAACDRLEEPRQNTSVR
jgi:P pilus assembly chaperone PapD